jgi:hypothetical protein
MPRVGGADGPMSGTRRPSANSTAHAKALAERRAQRYDSMQEQTAESARRIPGPRLYFLVMVGVNRCRE